MSRWVGKKQGYQSFCDSNTTIVEAIVWFSHPEPSSPCGEQHDGRYPRSSSRGSSSPSASFFPDGCAPGFRTGGYDGHLIHTLARRYLASNFLTSFRES